MDPIESKSNNKSSLSEANSPNLLEHQDDDQNNLELNIQAMNLNDPIEDNLSQDQQINKNSNQQNDVVSSGNQFIIESNVQSDKIILKNDQKEQNQPCQSNIGQKIWRSDNFSQTNSDNQIDFDQSNTLISNPIQSLKVYNQQDQIERHQQDKSTQLDADELDANKLSKKLIDLNQFEQAFEAVESEKSANKFDLPDLISSPSIDRNQQENIADNKTSTEDDIPSYQVKWIKFRNKPTAIITQNVNGPCPLLAIINVLLLRGKINLPSSTKIVTYDQMIVFLANFILENGTNNAPEGLQLDYEQNINDAMQLFPKLQTGLDVNVQFNSISSFEYTSEMIIFDLLGISLYHGWIVDQDDLETVTVIGNCSYNQLVDKIITNKCSSKSEEVTEALIAERFLESTASQLTYFGLSELASNVREQELSILFRNNHFITLYKNQNQLYQLVTDQGFLQEPDVVWMTLSHIDNDDVFVNHEFKPSIFKSATTLSPTEQKKQIDQDYLIALSMEEEEKKLASQASMAQNNFDNGMNYNTMMSDEELARKLQDQEDEFETENFMQLKRERAIRVYKDKSNENFNRHKNVETSEESQFKLDQQNWNQFQHRSSIDPQQHHHSTPYNVNTREARIEQSRNETSHVKRTNQNNHQPNSPTENHSSQSSSNSSRENQSNSNHSSNHKSKCIIS